MLTLARKRLQKDEEDGFTLIELMVVVLIIAILLAIAIPTFLGAQDRARDRAAQSDLRNSVTAAKTIATDNAGSFSTVDTAALTAAEGALTYAAGAPSTAASGTVTVTGGNTGSTNNADLMQFSTRSASGASFAIAITSKGDVGYCKWTTTPVVAAQTAGALTACDAAKF